MRRSLVALAVLATLWLLAAPVFAQAPAAPTPKVTINGFIDTVTSWSRNMSIEDVNVSRDDDTEWYARNRLRPDITAEVGTTKFVLGLEVDYVWGQTGAADNAAPLRSGASAGLDLNTDTTGILELKWGYVELDTPWIPGARFRLGAQPFATTYKTAVLATGDFAGAHWTWAAAPQFRINATYAQAEEEQTGPGDGFARGEDFAVIASVEISPFKGFDIRPIYAYFRADGTTSGSARQPRGGLATGAAQFPQGNYENRHTIGVDVRFAAGGFYIDPTAFFQFGDRELGPTRASQDMEAWFFDIRGGFQAGPLLIEGAFIYTTGNDATENVTLAGTDINYYQPINTDTSFYGGWAEVWALGIDYFNIINSRATAINPGVAIGYDKYGLMRIGARASYAITPAFTVRAAANANWTAEQVDTGAGSNIAVATGRTAASGGDDQYLGTEVNLGFTYRFVPNVALDVVGSYMIAGDALGSATATSNNGVTRSNTDPDDILALTARIRYSF